MKTLSPDPESQFLPTTDPTQPNREEEVLTQFLLSLLNSSRLDEDDYGGHGALLGEGFMPSVFVFQLFWILTYSLLHH